jgi:hypothetical protein
MHDLIMVDSEQLLANLPSTTVQDGTLGLVTALPYKVFRYQLSHGILQVEGLTKPNFVFQAIPDFACGRYANVYREIRPDSPTIRFKNPFGWQVLRLQFPFYCR